MFGKRYFRNIDDATNWLGLIWADNAEMNQKAGTLRRKGLRSLLRDEWEVLDTNDRVIGQLFEDSIGLALLGLQTMTV